MNLTSLRKAGALVATLALASGTLAVTATSAHAAGPTGLVSGSVVQPGGAAVPNSYLEFSRGDDTPDPSDDYSREFFVEDDGSYLQSLPAGTYAVSVYDDCNVYETVSTTVTVAANVEQTFNPQFTTLSSPAPTGVCARVYPEVTGVAKVGSPLTVSTGSYAQPIVSIAYQWRTSGGDEGIIPGATGRTYVPTANDLGVVFVTLTVTSASGTQTFSAYPDEFVKRGDYSFNTAPQVQGLPILGKTISASPGAVVPGAAVSYQWYRDGKAIAGQTARTHRVAKADYQKRLSAVIVYKTYGYATVTRSVKASFDAKKKAKANVKVSTAKRTATFTINVSPSASKKSKGKVSIVENGKTLKRVSIKSGTVKVKVSKLKKGKHKLSVIYVGKKNAAGTNKTVRITK